MQLYFTVTNMKKQKKCQTKLGFFVTVLLNKKLLKMTFFHVYPKFNDIFSEVKRRFKKFIMTTNGLQNQISMTTSSMPRRTFFKSANISSSAL